MTSLDSLPPKMLANILEYIPCQQDIASFLLVGSTLRLQVLRFGWTTVSSFNITSFDPDRASITSVIGKKGERSADTDAEGEQGQGVLRYTQALAIRLQDSEYHADTVNTDNNLAALATANCSPRVITVTQDTRFPTAQTFIDCVKFCASNDSLELAYLPKYIDKADTAEIEESLQNVISTWIQQAAKSEGHHASASDHGPDFFLERGTDARIAASLIKDRNNFHGLTMCGHSAMTRFSHSKLWRLLDLGLAVSIKILRMSNMSCLFGYSRINWRALTILELLDCCGVERFLKPVAEDITELTRLVIADSSFPRKDILAKNVGPASTSTINDHSILRIIRNNSLMKELCLYCAIVSDTNGSEVVAALPPLLEKLALVQTQSDMLTEDDVLTLTTRCPGLNNLGMTAFFFPNHVPKDRSEEGIMKLNKVMMYLSNLHFLKNLAIIRFTAANRYAPNKIAQAWAEIAFDQGVHLSVFSMILRKTRNRASEGRRLGDHYHMKVDVDGKVDTIPFKPKKATLVSTLRFITARFGGVMEQMAEAEGVRYQFHDDVAMKNRIGWCQGESLTEV